jgi:hypothetical protein
MNMQALLIRATVLAVLCVGLSVAMVNRHPVAQALPQTSAIAAQPVQAPIAPEPVLLPTVVVRPSAADLAEAMRDENADSDESPTLIEAAETRTLYDTIAPALPNVRLDMPYYSFGKVLPRVSKE